MRIIPETREEQTFLENNKHLVDALLAAHGNDETVSLVFSQVNTYADAALDVNIWGLEDISDNLTGYNKTLWETLTDDEKFRVAAQIKSNRFLDVITEYGNEALHQEADAILLEVLGLDTIGQAYAVARCAGETSLNGYEFLQDDSDTIKCFASAESAKTFLSENDYPEEDVVIETLAYFGVEQKDDADAE